MSSDEGRRIHPDEEESNNGVPDFGEFMHRDQDTSGNNEKVDLDSLLSEIRRVPSSDSSASRKRAEASPQQVRESEPVREAQPVRETRADEEPEPEYQVPQIRPQAPVRRMSPEERARRKAQIEAKRRRVAIMMAVTAVLLVLAIGMGIFYAVRSLTSSKKESAATSTSLPIQKQVVPEDSSDTPETQVTTTEETTPAPTPTPAVTPFPAGGPDLSGYCVVIDPGHQAIPNREQEEMSSSMGGSKDKSAKGFSGVVSGIDESEINLQTALLLRAYLESLGCEVYITRETNDVDISNKERAELAVSYHPDVYIRLFCNCANDSKTSGCCVIVPSSGQYSDQVVAWGDKLGDYIATSSGANYNGCWASGNYTGLNWASSIPSFMVRMGYLSNSDEETNLLSEEYQYKICEGIAQFVSTMPKN